MAGHTVVTATSSRMGMAQSREKSFDVALIDLGLPDSLGYEVIARLHTRDPDIKIIAMSATEVDNVPDAIDRGAAGILRKPFLLGDVNDLVNRLVTE